MFTIDNLLNNRPLTKQKLDIPAGTSLAAKQYSLSVAVRQREHTPTTYDTPDLAPPPRKRQRTDSSSCDVMPCSWMTSPDMTSGFGRVSPDLDRSSSSTASSDGSRSGTPALSHNSSADDNLSVSFCGKRKKTRTCFTVDQLDGLERAFKDTRYMPTAERKHLAKTLQISDQQVKTWFQNRRMKEKRLTVGQSPGTETSESGRGPSTVVAVAASAYTYQTPSGPHVSPPPFVPLTVFAPQHPVTWPAHGARLASHDRLLQIAASRPCFTPPFAPTDVTTTMMTSPTPLLSASAKCVTGQ